MPSADTPVGEEGAAHRLGDPELLLHRRRGQTDLVPAHPAALGNGQSRVRLLHGISGTDVGVAAQYVPHGRALPAGLGGLAEQARRVGNQR